MEQWKRDRFIRNFKKLQKGQQTEIVSLLRQFEKIMQNPELYQKECPKKRTSPKFNL